MTAHDDLRVLDARRWRIALTLTVTMTAVYFGFIALIAYDKPLMAHLITRGLTVGIALGVVVIVASWVLTWIYVRWANTHYDQAVRDVIAAHAAESEA